MNRTLLLLAGVAAFGLAACDHPDAKRQHAERSMKVVSKLDCPERQGGLKRSTAASDGLSCVYTSGNAEVTLRLVSLVDGDPAASLAPIEAELKALLPDASTTPPASAKDDVDIKLPGVSIQAGEQGAKVRAPGVEVNAVEGGCAEVRANRNIKVTTESKTGRDGVSGRYILACEDAKTEYKVVGYDARGPLGGPLVVGMVKVKAGETTHDDVFDDVGDLIRHNVGGRQGMNASITVD